MISTCDQRAVEQTPACASKYIDSLAPSSSRFSTKTDRDNPKAKPLPSIFRLLVLRVRQDGLLPLDSHQLRELEEMGLAIYDRGAHGWWIGVLKDDEAAGDGWKVGLEGMVDRGDITIGILILWHTQGQLPSLTTVALIFKVFAGSFPFNSCIEFLLCFGLGELLVFVALGEREGVTRVFTAPQIYLL